MRRAPRRNSPICRWATTGHDSADTQSTLVVQLDQLTYFQLILTLASCADKTEFNQYNVIVLDILHLIFRSVKAAELGQDQARVRRSVTAYAHIQASMENLNKLLELEKREKSRYSRSGMTRHSRFGTTVAVRAVRTRAVGSLTHRATKRSYCTSKMRSRPTRGKYSTK